MIRLIEEIKRIEVDNDPILDEKCIGLYNTMVVFLKTGKIMNLSENYFNDKNSFFDFYFAGCYITPGEITTIRKIHINALKSEIRNQLIHQYYEDKNNFNKKKELYFEYLPDFIKEIKK